MDKKNFSKEELTEALRAITSMISKSEKAQEKLIESRSQWTLLDRRIKALRIAESMMITALGEQR